MIVLGNGSGTCTKDDRGMCLSLQVAGVMDQFERQFEHLDVQTQTMEEAMSGVTTLTVPEVRIIENQLIEL